MVSTCGRTTINIDTQIDKKELETMAKDPVCGMEVDENTAKFTSEHMGKKFYFCMEGCKKKFDADPMKYMKHS